MAGATKRGSRGMECAAGGARGAASVIVRRNKRAYSPAPTRSPERLRTDGAPVTTT
jgi:hypothetical protein